MNKPYAVRIEMGGFRGTFDFDTAKEMFDYLAAQVARGANATGPYAHMEKVDLNGSWIKGPEFGKCRAKFAFIG